VVKGRPNSEEKIPEMQHNMPYWKVPILIRFHRLLKNLRLHHIILMHHIWFCLLGSSAAVDPLSALETSWG